MVDDAELVARSRKRDREAFGALVDRHQRLVFGVALARTRDPALAEDVAQEAFVAAWRDLGRLREGDRIGPWVAGIARNLAAGAVRTRARREATALPVNDEVAASPEDDLLAAEDRALLSRALADVPEAFREVLVLYYLEGESITRIAAALELREDLVKQRLSRGRRALRESVARRVESALDRARHRPHLRAAVLAALGTLGVATAAHASRAGKAAFMITAKQGALAGAALAAVAGGAIWLARGSSHATTTPTPPPTSAPTTRTAAASPPRANSPVVAKRDTPAEHAERLAAIRAEAARHAAATPAAPAAGPTPTSAGGGGGDVEGGGGGAKPPVDGDMDKDYIRSSMQALVPMLGDCYSDALQRSPGLGAGSIAVDFTIEGEPDAGGVISESKVDATESSLTDPGLRECIEQTMYSLDISAPTHGGTVKVHYPFSFSPGDDGSGSGSG
ncbi:MAG TPA: sigma-70 family RNA polymerase sigma factor [Kofleriaceae bacterium]|jgi:RNA polymerase sigma factor (sigma-70 family)